MSDSSERFPLYYLAEVGRGGENLLPNLAGFGRQQSGFLAKMELVPLVKSSMPDATHYPHPQDVANLILYLQTELALFEQWAAQEGIPPAALRPIERSQEALRRAVDQFELREWYRELTYGFRDQLGRLEEWL
jgi:hypothetical protein